MSRKTAREVAMKLTFARLFGANETDYEDVLEKSGITTRPTPADIKYSDFVLHGIELNRVEIDAWLSKASIDWDIERMGKVDYAILSIAIFEMLYMPDIPGAVSINEAVELAKKFGNEQSPAYINGVLGSINRQAQEE